MSGLTPAQKRELRCIAETGEPSDLYVWHASMALAFATRDRVIGALLRKNLIADNGGGFTITDAGRTVLTAQMPVETKP